MIEAALLLLALGGADLPPRSDLSDTPAEGVVRAALPPAQADGAPISRVFIDLYGSTGSASGDQAVRERIDAMVGVVPGEAYRASSAGLLAGRLQDLGGVDAAEVMAFSGSEPGTVVMVVRVVLAAAGDEAPDATKAAGFPVVSQGEKHILRVQFAGGSGVFVDHNPWFAAAPAFTSQSPIAQAPPGPGATQWFETSVEPGLAGAVRLGDAPATAFAEVTSVASASVGNDLFRDDTRWRNRIEKAYAGLAWVDPAGRGSLKLSGGRQTWQLYGGFLFSRFAAGANAGPHPGLYLSPRTAYERANLLDARWGNWRLEGFELDPAELDQFDSGSRFTGFNLRYQQEGRWELGATRYQVPESRSRVALASGGSVPREGLRTVAGRAGISALPGLPGWELLAEYAHQDHESVDWDAQAWYGQVRYQFNDLPWTPNITYRRARFSGDDPSTPGQEAFDAPLSSGLDEWVQGVSFKKVVTNSNLDSHRLRINFGPDARLNYTIDYFRLDAHRVLPGKPSHYGDELNVAVRWAISPRLFLLGVTGVAWPGEAMQDRAGGRARPWNTYQLSLFWGF